MMQSSTGGTDDAGSPGLQALLRSVDATLAGILSGDFPVDPILGREVSHLVSKAASLQKRHGHLLEAGIVTALRASHRFEVLTSVAVPITSAADSVVASTPPETLERISLRYDGPTARSVNLDFIVVDTEAGWAGAYDCKRGNGALTQRLLRPLVRDLECVGVLLRSFLRDRGYSTIDRVTVGLVDVYGASGVPEHLALNLDHLDAHFGVAITPILGAMNVRLEEGFRKAVPELLAPMRKVAAQDAAAALASAMTDAVGEARPEVGRTPARFSGPGASDRSGRAVPGRRAGLAN